MHRGDEFYALSKLGPYTFGRYIVAARDNTKFCSCVIPRVRTPWGEFKQNICVKHTIIISRDIEGRFIDKNEAHYINGILNCDIITEYMKNTFKSNGFSLKKAHFFLPLFDVNNDLHVSISELSKKASRITRKNTIIKIQKQISELYIQMCNQRD